MALVTEADVVSALAAQVEQLSAGLAGLTAERAAHRYAEGKWSVREVVGHVIDTERVFGYRALSIARGETATLPSFDENAFARVSGHDRCPLSDLVNEFLQLRASHVLMFRHLVVDAWDAVGNVGGHATSTRAMAFIMVGHVRHHMQVLSERYGVKVVAGACCE